MNRIGLISAEITLFFLGAIAPAYARQDQHDQNSQAPKQEEAKPAEQRQVKPEEQKQAKPEAQRQRQQQAKPTKPEQAKANGKPPQQQTQAPRQLHQQPKSQIEQTNANDHQQQQVRNQQAILSRPQSSRVPQRTADAQARQHAEHALHLSATSRNRIPDERFIPISAAHTSSVSGAPEWLTDIPASSTADIGSDLSSLGQEIGITPTMSTLILSAVNIICAIRTIQAFTSRLAL